ncbi:hypothetical protein BDR22DRAFT_841102 [Usnea florida]
MSCYVIDKNVLSLDPEQSLCGTPNTTTDTTSATEQHCCQEGDTCLSNAICYFTHPGHGYTSGYYIGGCIEKSFQSPTCSQQCSDHPTQDIVYNGSTDLWHCCYGSGTLDCSFPSPETFEAPSPQQLLQALSDSTTLLPLPSSITSSSSSNPVTINHASVSSHGFSIATLLSVAVSSTSPIAPSSTSSGLTSHPSTPAHSSPTSRGVSTNAKIGIAIAVTLAILGLAIWALGNARRKRRRDQSGNQISEKGPIAEIQDGETRSARDAGAHLVVELSAE